MPSHSTSTSTGTTSTAGSIASTTDGTTSPDGITVRVIPNERGIPHGKLADVELHFTSGPLAGLKLVGFAVWERRSGAGRNVTFPSRTYSINGDRRSFSLLRPTTDAAGQDRIRDRVLTAYAEYERAESAADAPHAATALAEPTAHQQHRTAQRELDAL